MPIKINEVSGEEFLVVHVWGKLVKADYERFLPQFAELSQRPGKLRLLFDMIGFEGWDAGALYDELKFDLKHANAHALARYAALCQEAGLVPIVEPEVLMEGDHTLARCSVATEQVLRAVFDQLAIQGVALEGMILKPNMVLPGLTCPKQPTANEVADATVGVLRLVVPVALPGIAFLSGGQSGVLASERLNAMNSRFKAPSAAAPWALTFSFARALQQPALEIWAGKDTNREAAQRALLHRARCNRAARQGLYTRLMEATSPKASEAA